MVRLLGCDKFGEEDATWKEVVLLKGGPDLEADSQGGGGVVHVFNLVSHGRRVWRTQVYSSKSAVSLASLEPMLGDRKAMPEVVASQVRSQTARARGRAVQCHCEVVI